jgi:hypothetical protein
MYWRGQFIDVWQAANRQAQHDHPESAMVSPLLVFRRRRLFGNYFVGPLYK